MMAIRMVRMVVGLAAVVLALSNILFVRSAYVSLAVIGLVVLWIVLTVFQLYYLSRVRSRWGASGIADGPLLSLRIDSARPASLAFDGGPPRPLRRPLPSLLARSRPKEGFRAT